MTSEPTKPPRFRTRIKKLALRASDSIAGRSGSTRLPRARLRDYLEWRPDPRPGGALLPEAARLPSRATTGADPGPIFLTGRFRAGTTLLWNLFRHAPGTTAYYEPFNERRWFDPAARGARVDDTHRGVSSYWDEYEGMADIAPLFRSRWHERNLYMGADARDGAMEKYVRALIDRATGRAVLQFNRIDFRLAWFRARFPDAVIVHLVRNPRDQWLSTLIDPARFGSDAPSDQFARCDHFYLRLWLDRLGALFPSLDQSFAAHPYRAHYQLWRLSQAFGLAYADLSLGFEELIGEAGATIGRVFATTGIEPAAAERVAGLVEPQPIGRWSEYATDDWFTGHEDGAERALAELFA